MAVVLVNLKVRRRLAEHTITNSTENEATYEEIQLNKFGVLPTTENIAYIHVGIQGSENIN